MAVVMITRRGGGMGSTSTPGFTYTGSYDLVTDSGGYSIRFKTSGTLTLARSILVDAVLVGGGGGGQYGVNGKYARGGGSGYNAKPLGVRLARNTQYSIVIGSGGARNNGRGGTTSAFGYKAEGGYGGDDGGAGTAQGGYGTNGGDGFLLFGDSALGYVCGGGASGYGSFTGGKGGGGNANGKYNADGGNGTANTGGGGAGGSGNSEGGDPGSGGYGGSGVVVIRNTRA